MSHTSAISSVIITDLNALRAAISELKGQGVNCDLLENAKPRAYYADQQGMGQAPYVVRLNDGPYDVGLYRNQADTGYEAKFDTYGGHVARYLGAETTGEESRAQGAMGKLLNLYAVQAATREATRKGYRVQRINQPNGGVQLQIRQAA